MCHSNLVWGLYGAEASRDPRTPVAATNASQSRPELNAR